MRFPSPLLYIIYSSRNAYFWLNTMKLAQYDGESSVSPLLQEEAQALTVAKTTKSSCEICKTALKA